MAECVWLRKGDEHFSHSANRLWVALGEAFIHYRIGQFRGNKVVWDMSWPCLHAQLERQ